MRCEDVIRELAAPTGIPVSADLADHLAHCPSCAAWAGRDAQLARLWEATRPPELSESARERIWAHVSEALDRPTVPIPVLLSPALAPASPRPWRRALTTAFLVAQAAAILIGVVLLTRQGQAKTPKIVIGQDVVMISLDGPSPRVQTVARSENPNAVDGFYVMLNRLEGIADVEGTAELQ